MLYGFMFERYAYCMTKSIPAHALYGSPVGHYRLAHTDTARLAAPSAPYVGRGNKCSANEDSCEGMRAKGTELCMGHLKARDAKDKKFLLETEPKVVTDASSEND